MSAGESEKKPLAGCNRKDFEDLKECQVNACYHEEKNLCCVTERMKYHVRVRKKGRCAVLLVFCHLVLSACVCLNLSMTAAMFGLMGSVDLSKEAMFRNGVRAVLHSVVVYSTSFRQ